MLYGIVKEYSPDQLMLEKEWDLSFNAPFKDEISTRNPDDVAVGKAVSKLFDKKGLLEYWFENYRAISPPKHEN